ncbi:helix-turn-helix domain-containing protein [Curtobacterium herbarum]|uniref:HTH cro/C1-type domain-containing protein n=1 Tax=Curtobacterium herbarum TaxID=150122 RepID=A0ABP4KAM3_9MICO|nr:helix-turn-helix transcriptional regulator [Curtobacterium herbarum]MBM7474567.1 transcriptional regulator with XRE-family HTH domain [Curtobacterium herbarum]MCS6545948.1 helix-turn-helix domain-containing protein [Curtobacterium herbarum]
MARAIIDERLIRQLSRVELAACAGVTPDVVADLERGRPGVGLYAIRSVLRALDVEPLALPPVTTEAGR